MSLVRDMDTKVVQVDRARGSDLEMVWGMPKTAYRLLSAKERKRVRNRVRARVFRTKRKGEQVNATLRTINVVFTLSKPWGRTTRRLRAEDSKVQGNGGDVVQRSRAPARGEQKP